MVEEVQNSGHLPRRASSKGPMQAFEQKQQTQKEEDEVVTGGPA